MGRGERFKPPKEEGNILKLPTEISLDILSRLPVKTVVNCSSVCKAWRSLLLDPSFPKMHLAKSSVNLMLYGVWWLIEFEKDLEKREMSKFSGPLPLSSAPYVVGSCNGLLCLLVVEGENLCYNVWNPVIKNNLPMPNIQRRKLSRYRGVDVFSGFGFCPKTNVYKVIIITRSRDDKARCEVCTVGTNAWKTVEDVPVPYCSSLTRFATDGQYCFLSNTSLNGAVHWFSNDSKIGDEYICLWVCAFRIDDEKWDPILLPLPLLQALCPYGLLGWEELGVLENCLAIFNKPDKYLLDIWMMKEYGVRESWTKCWSIESQIPSVLAVCSLVPLRLTNDGELLMFDSGNKTLVCFSPGQRLITRKQKIYGIAKWYVKGIAYVPSFISPTGIEKLNLGYNHSQKTEGSKNSTLVTILKTLWDRKTLV